jgi:hypothetical protein
MGALLELIRELWEFMRERKKLWMAPILALLLLMSVFVVLTQGSAIAPFVYALF